MARTVPSADLQRPETEADDAALPSVRVIAAVADATDADPTAMAPLYDVVDPDALDKLVESALEGHVQFAFGGHEVTVHGDGSVVVDGTEQGGA